MYPGLTLITGPEVEPLTLAQAKLHVEIDSDITKYDESLNDLIKSAREWCEKYTGRALIDQTWEFSLPRFYNVLYLPKPPIIALVSVVYVDSGGVETTLPADQYELDNWLAAGPGVVPTYGNYFPSTRYQPRALRVRYRAGYVDRTGSPTQDVMIVPAPLRNAMKVYIAALFENRESGDAPKAAENLARPYRVEGLGA